MGGNHEGDGLGLPRLQRHLLEAAETLDVRNQGRYEIGTVQERSMVHHSSMPDILCIAGKLLSVNRHVVSSVDLSSHPKLCKCFYDRFTEYPHIQRFKLSRICNIGIVQIPQIMVNCTAA